MPPTLAIGAFVLGGVLLLLSVVRGGFKIFGAEVKETAGGIARVVAFLAGVVLIITGFLHDGKDQPEHVADRAADRGAAAAPQQTGSPLALSTERQATRRTEAATRQTPADPEPEIRVEWRAATQELVSIVASLTDAEKYMLGMNAMVTGQDIFAIYVRVTNVGGVAVDVSPERIQLTYGGQPVPLNRADDSRFFRATRLQPNRHAEGILTFNAPVMVGGLVVNGGRLSYQDPAVQVTYAR